MKRFLIPLGLFMNPQEIPSPFIGKPAPSFTLTQLEDGGKSFSPQDMRGKVWLLNVWASWCAPCRAELPTLVDFSKKAVVPIVGLDYTDVREDGNKWLRQFGNPYQLSAFDGDGKVGIDYGVYGVPETFVIDKSGVIRMKHVGPVTSAVIKDTLLPLIQELNRA